MNTDIKVTKINILTKEVCVDFDNQDSIKILLNTFLELNLYENKIITINDYQNIKNKDEFYRLKDYAYYLLKFRDYCEKEMELSLYKYNPNMEFINEIINDLKKKNYLNDYSYAKYLIEKMSLKKYSKAKAIKELETMEIDSFIIDELIKDYDEFNILKSKINKMFDLVYKKKTFDNAKKDIYQKCLFEGFDGNIISEVLDDINYDFEENYNHDIFIIENEYTKIKKKIKNDCSKEDFQVKLIRKMLQKGYSYESIMDLIRKDELKDD